MIDLSNVIALALGSDDVLQIQDAIGTVLWQKIIYYNVNISAGSNGIVSVNGVSGDYSQSVPSGTVLTIEGTGNTGYDFDEWSDGNTDNPRTITVTGDLTLTAAFESAVTYYNVSISAGSNGSVSVNGVSGNYSQSVASGTVLTLAATPDTGYDFDEWSDGNTDNPRTLTVTGDITLTGAFEAVALPNYFYVEDISGSDNTLSITKNNSSAPTIEVFKSTDKVNWSSIGNTSTTAITATIPANGKLYLKATTNAWGANPYTVMGNVITVSGNHNVGGNIMSLLYGDSFTNQTTLNNYSFVKLFFNDTKLVNISSLELPATTLATGCYQQMFYGCTSLTTAPALPATTLAQSCYQSMFAGCTALTTAPALPATTLATSCYHAMFDGCSSLTTAPVLPATTLATSCYNSMFDGCSSLTTAPALPATTLTNYCYQNMFSYCTSLTTAPALPATTLATECYSNMFKNCRGLTTAPALPATTLTTECYREMFVDCRALTTAPALPATTLATRCYNAMFQGCTALTTAPALPATTLTTSCYNWMFKNCTNLNNVTTYADDISAGGCLNDWLDSVSATGDFWNLGTAIYPSGASGIPSGWTEHNSL